MTATVIDIADLRARRATGQPLADKPAHRVDLNKVLIPGRWVRTSSGLIGMIRDFTVLGGVSYAYILAGDGIVRCEATASLTPTQPSGGAA